MLLHGPPPESLKPWLASSLGSMSELLASMGCMRVQTNVSWILMTPCWAPCVHLILSSLPTIILGDFNCDAGRLPFCKLLLQRGWQDLAQLWSKRTSQPVQPTWLGREGLETRIDFIFAPPELVQYLSSFLCNPDSPTDHAEIVATFNFSGGIWQVAKWRMPQDATTLLALLTGEESAPSHLLWTFTQATKIGDLVAALQTFTQIVEATFKVEKVTSGQGTAASPTRHAVQGSKGT